MNHPEAIGYFHEERLSFDYPQRDADGVALKTLDVPDVDLHQTLGKAWNADKLKHFPQMSEFDVVRHFTRLSKMNVSIDASMYPLGSCTMKYNPKLNEVVARLEGFCQTHPHMADKWVQGNLALLYHLEQLLLEITGFSALSLQPAAGAQGELTGILLIRARQEAKGERREFILVPDSAHGTNPSTAAIAGYKVRQIKSTGQGYIDIDSLAEAMDESVAGLMLTNPNTLGIFEKDILQIAEIVHSKGGYIYCDGANMNAQLGIVRPGDYGMDVMHLNLHKTFSTPHGGGGPGSGPCLCTEELAPYLPVPRVEKEGEKYSLNWNVPESIGKVSSFYGNFGVLIRALAFTLALGSDGLREAGEAAIVNANYLKHHLKDKLQLSTDQPTLHEVVFSDKTLPHYGNISTLDLAKRLIDFGFHPPTTYFPLTVKGALMIEPTESEPREELDRFIHAINNILEEAQTNPEIAKTAPHYAPRKRLDETQAARNPILRWAPETSLTSNETQE